MGWHSTASPGSPTNTSCCGRMYRLLAVEHCRSNVFNTPRSFRAASAVWRAAAGIPAACREAAGADVGAGADAGASVGSDAGNVAGGVAGVGDGGGVDVVGRVCLGAVRVVGVGVLAIVGVVGVVSRVVGSSVLASSLATCTCDPGEKTVPDSDDVIT